MRLHMIALLTGAAALTGCAATAPSSTPVAEMAAADCASADWWALGRADGAAGFDLGAQRAAACPMDVGATDYYAAGQAEGIVAYCAPEAGRALGKARETYRNVCPPHMAAAHRSAYDAALSEPWYRGLKPNLGIGVGVGIGPGGIRPRVGIGAGVGVSL